MMIGRLISIAAMLMASAAIARAQDAPATTAGISAARATADRLISEAGAAGIFANTTDDDVAEVTHVPSGIVCRFYGSAEDRIYVFPQSTPQIPRGDDIGCISRNSELAVDLTLYATRYRPLPSEEAVLADAVNAIRNRWPDAQPYEGALASINSDGHTPLAAAYKIQVGDEFRATLVLISHRGEWGYKVRATGPYDDAMATSIMAGMMLETALMDQKTP